MRWMRTAARLRNLKRSPPPWLLIVPAVGMAAAPLHAAPVQQAKRPELRAIGSLGGAGGRPVKVRGAVTLVAPGFLVLQDQSGAVEVRPEAGSDSAAIGDEVEGTGTLPASPSPMLAGKVERLWSGSTPLAGMIGADAAADGQNKLLLVTIRGQLAAAEFTGGGLELILQGEHQFFTASLPEAARASQRWPTEDALRKALRPKATLELTGVLDAAPPARGAEGSFTLALRSPEDIAVLLAPPWWTPAHISGLFLAFLTFGATAAALHIRNLRLRFRAVTEERLRIARDIHDTSAQGFAGLALQLQAAAQTLPEAAGESRRHLDLALGMVRHSRRESHRSIQMLRSLAAENSLGTMLEQSARQAADGAAVRIEINVEGQEPKLPYNTAMELYRIAQEGIANAVQHAAAGTVRLQLEFRKHEIAMSVADDGGGFDPAGVQANGEHFGLAGIQERVEGLRGRFHIASSALGSKLSVAIPWPP